MRIGTVDAIQGHLGVIWTTVARTIARTLRDALRLSRVSKHAPASIGVDLKDDLLNVALYS